jgi:Domain of unknown function (DUF4190)
MNDAGWRGPPPGGFGAPPAGFGPPAPPFTPPAPQWSPLAIASMILGLLSMPTCCCGFLGAPLGLASLVLGIVSLGKIRGESQVWKGSGMAIAGIVMGATGLLMTVVAIVAACLEAWQPHWFPGAF